MGNISSGNSINQLLNNLTPSSIYVVVQIYPWYKNKFFLIFLLFLGMVMYDNLKQMEIKPRIKLNPNIIEEPRI